jgi:hypothetical protein
MDFNGSYLTAVRVYVCYKINIIACVGDSKLEDLDRSYEAIGPLKSLIHPLNYLSDLKTTLLGDTPSQIIRIFGSQHLLCTVSSHHYWLISMAFIVVL